MPIAEVRCTCGRQTLFVAGYALAMEGDKCRHMLPADVCRPIPAAELSRATIGGKPASDMPIDVVRFFRGDVWDKKMLDYVAEKINQRVAEAQ